MTEHTCRRCTFYFKRTESIDEGINIPVEGCVREIDDSNNCHEFQEKKHRVNDKFLDSLQGEKMTLDEWKDLDRFKTQARLKVLNKMLRHIEDNSGNNRP